VSRNTGTDGDAGAPGLLARPAEEAARLLALGQVDRARRARAALATGDDREALHDLRVALRRLRSATRAYRVELRSAIGKGPRRRLRRLARATNAGRDAEVGESVVERWLAELPASAEQRAAGALRRRLAERRENAYAALDPEFGRRVDELLDELERRLSVWRREVSAEAPAGPLLPLRGRVAEELERHRARFETALDEAAGGDPDAAHAARIEAKRLRYLLEPLVDELPAAGAPVRRLRRLQDLLGDANDLVTLGAELAAMAAAAERARLAALADGTLRATPSPGGRRGRRALAERIAGERRALAATFGDAWLAPRARERRRTAQELERLAAALAR
jgi:CHAD domain-containing protein